MTQLLIDARQDDLCNQPRGIWPNGNTNSLVEVQGTGAPVELILPGAGEPAGDVSSFGNGLAHYCPGDGVSVDGREESANVGTEDEACARAYSRAMVGTFREAM